MSRPISEHLVTVKGKAANRPIEHHDKVCSLTGGSKGTRGTTST